MNGNASFEKRRLNRPSRKSEKNTKISLLQFLTTHYHPLPFCSPCSTHWISYAREIMFCYTVSLTKGCGKLMKTAQTMMTSSHWSGWTRAWPSKVPLQSRWRSTKYRMNISYGKSSVKWTIVCSTSWNSRTGQKNGCYTKCTEELWVYVTIEESLTSFSPFSLADCTHLSHFSFNDFIAIAFLDLAGDLDI